MKFGERAFSLISLAFGLVAAGALALAVATDFWIHAIEPIRVDNETTIIGSFDVAPPAAGDQASYVRTKSEEVAKHTRKEQSHGKRNFDQDIISDEETKELFDAVGGEFDKDDDDIYETDIGFLPETTDQNVPITYDMHSHSGLWRICIIYEEPDLPPESCSTIGYFSQTSERVEKGDTTNSINRAIRKSAPIIVGSLLVLLVALTLSILGTTKNDYRTIVSAVVYIFSALGLAMGIVMYISAVNDEVSHRKKTIDKAEKSFQYHYGWAFFFCGATFICTMVAAISNISLYLLRYSSLEDKTCPNAMRFGQVSQDSGQHSTTFTLNPLIPNQLQNSQPPLVAALYISIGGRFKEVAPPDET